MPISLPDFWTALGIGIGLAGVALALIVTPNAGNGEFLLARICLIIPGVLFLGLISIWGARSSSAWRIAFVAVAGASIAAGLSLSLRWIYSKQSEGGNKRTTDVTTIKIESAPGEPYQTTQVINGQVLSRVSIGLKAVGRTYSNCVIYIEDISPRPPLEGGLPIRLGGNAQMLRPDDPQTLIEVASHWDNVTQFRFTTAATSGFFAESMNYIDDDPTRTIRVKVTAIGFEKTELFKIWTDADRRIHLAETR